MRQKGTVQAPSSFLWASIHHPPIRGGAQWGHASSWVWDGNTICSVSYCIHHCSMRELWERSALSKNLIEDVKSWDGFQALLIFPSVSLSFMPRLNKSTAPNSTHDASREIYKIGAFSLRVCLEWRCICRQLLKLSQHFVARAERVNLMKPVKNMSNSHFTWKSK